jgi:hypothetical protein
VHKEAKIAEIYALAEQSIALPMLDGCPAVTTFRLQLERYLQLCEARTALEAQTDALLGDSAEVVQARQRAPAMCSVDGCYERRQDA